MKHLIESCLRCLAILCALFVGAVQAQSFPSKSVTIIVPYPAGGGTDIVARILAQELTTSFGQPVIVRNVAGATGSIGTGLTARAAPDGYTVVIVPNSHAISAALLPNLPYDSVRDFEPISLVTAYPYVLVAHPNVQAHSLTELFQLARSKPGEMMYASSGNGTAGHLAMELLLHATSTTMTHVPYSGSSPALLDLQTGRVSTMFDPAATTIPLIKAGKLRPLAVSTPQRSPMLPDVPTVAEASGIPDFDASGWLALLAPAKTPRAIIDRYNSEITRILQIPSVRQAIERTGQLPQYSTPEALRAKLTADIAKWAKVIEVAKVRAKQ